MHNVNVLTEKVKFSIWFKHILNVSNTILNHNANCLHFYENLENCYHLKVLPPFLADLYFSYICIVFIGIILEGMGRKVSGTAFIHMNVSYSEFKSSACVC